MHNLGLLKMQQSRITT